MERLHLKKLRSKHGLSSERLAELVGVSQGHMSRIENGTRGLSIPIAAKIAEQLKTDVQTVLGLTNARGEPAPPSAR